MEEENTEIKVIDNFDITRQSLISKIKISIYSMPVHKMFYSVLLFFIIIMSMIIMTIEYSYKYTLRAPATGGIYREASINNIRYIDPIFANNETEVSISRLVYSGILRQEGELYIPEIAESINVSTDGLVYTIKLKKVKFSDGSDLTSADIMYTIELIQDSLINSPRHNNWKNIELIAIDVNTISMKTKLPISMLQQALTQGIIKKSEWIKLPKDSLSLSNLNINAIGAGPYKMKQITENNKIISDVSLIINDKYSSISKLPFIQYIYYKVFANNNEVYNAIKNGDTYTLIGVDPSEVNNLIKSNNKINIKSAKMYRTYSLFFNTNNDKELSSLNYRRDLRDSINRDHMLDSVLAGHGSKANNVYTKDYESKNNIYNLATTSKIYTGKTLNISTINNNELIKVANMIKEDWAKIGVMADIHTYEIGEFHQDVIKDRNYSVLLFAVDTFNDDDIYNLWHSSGRNYPGSNITNYYSTNLDKNLEKLSSTVNKEEKSIIYGDIGDELDHNVAWIPLYNPYMLATMASDIHINIDDNIYSSDRLLDYIRNAYIDTETVYNMFTTDTFYKKINDFLH